MRAHEQPAEAKPAVINPSPAGEGTAYLDQKQASEYLGIVPGRLQEYRASGRGPRFTKLGQSVRYRREWLDAWAEANACNSIAEAKMRRKARDE